jgi:hypothetical protein
VTAKSVIQVDIDPEGNFKAFYDMYKEYEDQVEKSAGAWKEMSGAIDDAEGPMEALLDLAGKNADAATIAAYQANVIAKEIRQASMANAALLAGVKSGAKAQKEFSDEASRGAKSFSKMAKDSKDVAHSIFGIGKFLLKLGAIGGGIAGLGGIISAISLKDLAQSAVQTQSGARALGITPGQFKAFDQDFSRYVNPGLLNSVANAQNSFQGQVWLGHAAGMGLGQVSSSSPDQLAVQLALKAHDWWQKTPASMRTSENLSATGFTQSGLGLEDVRQLGNTPRSELERAQAEYQKDQKSFNVSDKNTDAWYEFLRQLKSAGNMIETDLTNRLATLAPSLKDFADTLSKDAKILIDNILTPSNVKALADGINDVSSYLGSSQFKQDIKDFAGLVGLIAEKMRAAARFLGIDTGPAANSGGSRGSNSAPSIALDPGLDPDQVQRETHGRVTGYGGISSVDKALGYARHFLTMPQHPTGPNANPRAADEAKNLLAALDAKNSLPPGTLEAIWSKESSEGKNLVGPVLRNGDQAIGDFQFTSATWKDWGKNGDRFNFKDEANAAGSYMSSLQNRYKGDIGKALAAYNWGPGNIDRASANGKNWQSSLPPESRDYIAKITAALAKRQAVNVKVTVDNKTAARVAVQANAAAQ